MSASSQTKTPFAAYFIPPQARFRRAALEGDVQEMRKACREGARPDETCEEPVMSAWGLVVSAAPENTMKACFAFLAEEQTPLTSSHAQASIMDHPAYLLLMRNNLSALEMGRTFWRLWKHMSTPEQRRLVSSIDLDTSFVEQNAQPQHAIHDYKEKLASIWSEEGQERYNRISTTYTRLQTLTAPLFHTLPVSHPPVFLDEMFLSLRSLFLKLGPNSQGVGKEDIDWGTYFATAPKHVLHACLSIPDVVTLLQEQVADVLRLFLKEDLSTEENVQQVALRILRRCHKAGLRWPDHWPEETQEILRVFPHIQAWIDKQALINSIAPPSSSSSRRARV